MAIIYNTDCAYIQKRVVGLKRAPHNARVDLRRDSSLSKKREEPLDALDEDDCLGRR